ncbi:hypothetical protein BD289DRAFT_361487 [Coniella lustricola]|uniref:Uncharacterized protein n=1 Tax=Coniella lustricola TaxID=2025994 RepID=A0A2T3AI89_9PEZI|nr:hypothetical protein BD289DRAFT_361487 [Coniella lustricola]
MPSTLNAPVLQVDANIVKLVDTSNPQNLYNLWSMMSRCADSLPQGRRLENLIWRLMMEEVAHKPTESTTVSAPTTTTTTQPREVQRPVRKSSADDMPQLSGSVDSIADEEAVEFTSDSSPLDILRPRIIRQDSSASYPSKRDRHISSDNLEKMVASIVEQKEPLSAPLPEIPAALSPPKQEHEDLESSPVHSGSTTTESPSKESDCHSDVSRPATPLELPIIQTTTVVRGFSPAQYPHSLTSFTPPRSHANTDIPDPTSSPAAKKVEPKKRATFTLGASSEESYSDDHQSVEARQTLAPPVVVSKPKKMFQIGGSSEEESSLKSALASPRDAKLAVPKKSASFANHLTTTIPSTSSSAIAEDDEEISYDESAIESDDDDWEDSNEDSGANSVDEKTLFQRVDSKANLTSRRSLITLALEQNQRRSNLGGATSRSTPAIPNRNNRVPYNGPSLVSSPNDSDDAPLTMKRQTRAGPMRPSNEIPRSNGPQPKPIMTTAPNGISQQPLALSPRTTRRNMLATELTESLRRDLLHERSQLKRRHTATNVANLKQYPQQAYMNKGNNDVNASSWNEDFSRDTFGGYHSKGW